MLINRYILFTTVLLNLTACVTVGPDFVRPEVGLNAEWDEAKNEKQPSAPSSRQSKWWLVFNDPVLNNLVEKTWQKNLSLELAGLRVLEARARLGVAEGTLFPQTQAAVGSITKNSSPTTAGRATYWQQTIGIGASWEIDFWGRFKRGIESADAAFAASLAAREQIYVILTAQVVDTYLLLRINQELLLIAHENVEIQQRSYDMATVLYRNGSSSKLDMQQAKTLLLSTKATIPGYEVMIKRYKNALSLLLGSPPGLVEEFLLSKHLIPNFPESVETGIPADLLRQRPDVRQAELFAKAINATVGLAKADLYPSFSLTGSIGLAAGGAAGGSLGALFTKDSLAYSAGPSFVWPFLNYGRIKNNVRVQDARLQQALIQYRETVLQAAREVEDAAASFHGALNQVAILRDVVSSAKRSNELSILRYREGLSGYQRVLDSQKSLFRYQQNLINQYGSAVRNLVALFTALGGNWQFPEHLISKQSQSQMKQRSDWGDLLHENNE